MSDISPLEMEVLQMCAGTKDWPQQPMAWVNACLEFLQDSGYVQRRSTTLTDKGRAVFS